MNRTHEQGSAVAGRHPARRPHAGYHLTGRFTAYVKPGLAPLLLIAGGVLLVVGIISLTTSVSARVRARSEAHPAQLEGGDAHGHAHGRSRAPWLILAPALVLLLVAPPALGAEAVAHNQSSQALAGKNGVAPAQVYDPKVALDAAGGTQGGYAFNDGSGHGEGTAAFAKQRPVMSFPSLPAGDNPQIEIKDFVMRALYESPDVQQAVTDTPVTVTGFIAATPDGYASGYSIARLTINCCAADASPMQVRVDAPAPYGADTWVTAVITAVDGTATQDNGYVPTVKVVSIQPTSQPSDPYEH